MSSDAPPTGSVPQALRLAHRGTLALLAVFALAIVATAGEPTQATTPRGYTVTAVALAVLSISGRWIAGRADASPATALQGQLAGFGGAVAIGVVGVVLDLREGLTQTAVLYTLAGVLLAIRPPFAASAGDPAGG